MTELYLKYRPKKFSEIFGQQEAVRILKELGVKGEIPHALMFTGPSGTGKTTMARILRHRLKCSDMDFTEVNAADVRGIDSIRSISDRMGSSPIGGKSRVWVIDEAHGLTSQAQDSFLKLLEDTPKHVYFMLCTTDPLKLKKTIRSRCTQIKCSLLTVKEIKSLVLSIAEKEGLPIKDEVLSKIVEEAEGGARKALVLLNSIRYEDDPKKQVDLIIKSSTTTQAIDICRALMNPKTTWTEIKVILSANIEEEPETVRRIILGYAKAVLLKSANPRAAVILDRFIDHFYDSGHAGLVLACYDVVKN